MLTFDDEHLPPLQPNNDIVCNWQKPIQSFLKRLNKLYPFLKFEYYISAEFGKKGRLHCHPLWFVVPRDVTPVFKGATEQRFNEMLKDEPVEELTATPKRLETLKKGSSTTIKLEVFR